jgi:hypothetical protein
VVTITNLARHLRTLGEAGTVTTKTLTTLSIADRGVQYLFIGNAIDHSGNGCGKWDPNTDMVHLLQNTIWLKRMFFA